jgi:hypothetical protein
MSQTVKEGVEQPPLPPWPFPPPTDTRGTAAPSWACPEGMCSCHPVKESVKTVQHTIVFHDPQGLRMPGARCMVYENGQAVTPPTAAANAAGELHVELEPTTRSLFVEWCAPDLSTGSGEPYRKLYHVAVDTHPVRLRLANLGFAGRPRLEDNVRDYQRAFAEPETGAAQDIAAGLKVRHDQGGLTPFVPRPVMDRPPDTDEPVIAALHKGSLDGRSKALGDSPNSRSQSNAKVGEDKPDKAGGPIPQGAVVPAVGQVFIVVGLEPNGDLLQADQLTLRLFPLNVPKLPDDKKFELIKPTLVGVEWELIQKPYVLCVFKDVLPGSYAAIAHAGKITDVSRQYALGETNIEVKVGLLTLDYVKLTRDRPILTADDPLLELDVEVMQRRRKVLATIYTYFPQSADRATAPADMPPYEQGAYQAMLPGLDATNTCAPINCLVMEKAGAKGHEFGFGQVPVEKKGTQMIEHIPRQFVVYTAGAAPSVGDSHLLTDAAGFFHHCGVVVRSDPALNTVWLTADGGQPDRTTPFKEQNGLWRRYYSPPANREAAYIVARLFFGDAAGHGLIGNRFIFPGLTKPGGERLKGWTDITHPAVRFSSAFTKDITIDHFRAFKTRVREVEERATDDIFHCELEEMGSGL